MATQEKKGEPRRKQDTSALILQEWQLVLTGKPAETLVQLIYDYQMELQTAPLEGNKTLAEKYIWGLLIAGNYLDLDFFIARTKQVEHKKQLAKIAEAGSNERLKDLGAAVSAYLTVVKDGKLKSRIKEGTTQAILRILSKNFINYKLADLNGLFNTNEEEVSQLGYNVKDGYVQLKREEVPSDCLLTKLRELAIVANKMNKFE